MKKYKTVIVIASGTIKLEALLIREKNPRLVLLQDKVAMVTEDNVILSQIDLLNKFK